MEKSKIVIFVIIAILLTGIGFGVGYYLGSNKCENVSKENEIVPDKNADKKADKFSDEVKEMNEKDKDLHAKLVEYAEILYNNNSYKELSKKDNIYFASLNDFKEKYNYDISLFTSNGKNCNLNDTGVYFDVEHKLPLEYDDDSLPLISTLINCEKEDK